MTVRIVTDSTCDLPESLVAQYGITVVPLYINIGEQSWLDGVELTREEFYARLPDADPAPTTAVPGSETFAQVYRRLGEEGADEIVSIHISETLSATVSVVDWAEAPCLRLYNAHAHLGWTDARWLGDRAAPGTRDTGAPT